MNNLPNNFDCETYWQTIYRQPVADWLPTLVHQQLPVATPGLLAIGEVEGWAYLVQRRLPGVMLRTPWPDLPQPTKLALAHQQGEIMAALHALLVDHAPASLAFDWTEMLTEQKVECRVEIMIARISLLLTIFVIEYT